jgi:hypothetical protein
MGVQRTQRRIQKWQHGIVAYSLKISPPLKWHIT